jgi:DNA-binding NarL/FixJ family response regulator
MDAVASATTCKTATAAAFYLCAVAPYDDVKKALARATPASTAGLLLASTACQCEGDMPRAESALRRAAEGASEDDRPYVVDVLAPLLISRGLFARAAASIASTASPKLELGRVALQAVVDAASGATHLSAQRAASIREALPHLGDDVMRLRISHRLALAAYWRRDPAEALVSVAEGLHAAKLLGAHRFAATLHSVAYETHQTCTGDSEAAWRHALSVARDAELGGDASQHAWACVRLYELAAERGDDDALADARLALDARLSEPLRERFPAGVAEALRLARHAEFAAARDVLTVLKDTVGRSESERALCRALMAVASVALHDLDAARRLSRQAISSSARPDRHLAAQQLRYRRLARALASAAGEIVGDVVRGRRAAAARFLHGDGGIATLVGIAAGAGAETVPETVRGYAHVLVLARERYQGRPSSGPLTAMEVQVLRLVDSGKKAPAIAALLDRSPHTIRTHLRNVSAKLETHGRAQTLARAREMGLLRDS